MLLNSRNDGCPCRRRKRNIEIIKRTIRDTINDTMTRNYNRIIERKKRLYEKHTGHRIEPFSLFTNKSVEKKTLNETINKTLNQAFMENTQKCQNKLTQDQVIALECDVSEEVEREYAHRRAECNNKLLDPEVIGALSNIPNGLETMREQCDNLYPCVFTDITQDSIVSFNAACEIDSEMVQQIKQDIIDKLNEKLTDKSDGFTKTVNNVMSNITGSSLGGSSTEKIEETNRFITDISNIVDVKMAQEMLGEFSSSQHLSVKGGLAKGIHQKSTTDITQTLLNKNEQYDEVLNIVDRQVEIVVEEEERGLTDMWEDLTGVWGTWGIMLAVVVVAMVIGLAFILRSPESIKAVGEAGTGIASSARGMPMGRQPVPMARPIPMGRQPVPMARAIPMGRPIDQGTGLGFSGGYKLVI